MGALGSDAAIEAADIVLMDDDPLKISKAIKISRKCLRIVYEIFICNRHKAYMSGAWCNRYSKHVGSNICRCRCNGYCCNQRNKSIIRKELIKKEVI